MREPTGRLKWVQKKSLKRFLSQPGVQGEFPVSSLRIFQGDFKLFDYKSSATDFEDHFERELQIDQNKIRIDYTTNTSSKLPTLFWDILQEVLESFYKQALLGRETLEKYKEINSIFALSESVCSSKFLGDVTEEILKEYASILPTEYCAIWIWQEKKKVKKLVKIQAHGQLPESMSPYTEERFAQIVLEEHKIADIFVDSKHASMPEGFGLREAMFIPLKTGEDLFGGIFLIHPLKEHFQSGDLKLGVSLGIQASFSIENSLLFEEIESLFDSVVRGLIAAVDERDPTTSGHSARIALICERFARKVNEVDGGKYKDFNFSKQQLREIKYAGLLHDIGKIGVRENVLKKVNKLTDDKMEAILNRLDYIQLKHDVEVESAKKCVQRANSAYNLAEEDAKLLEEIAGQVYTKSDGEEVPWISPAEFEYLSVKHGNLTWNEVEEMRKHPEGTRKILGKIKFGKDLQNVAKIAAEHHEKLDGSGYPNGISGDEIMLQSQIMCIADIYEALIDSKRPYKPAYSPQEALRILEYEVKENKIDPDLYEIFKENLNEIVP